MELISFATAINPFKSKDITHILKEEHNEIVELFKKILETADKSVIKRKKLFSELKEKLVSHAHAEQAVLYVMMEKVKDLRKDALEAFQEHALVDDLFRKIDKIKLSKGEEWAASVQVLSEVVKHHVQEEENKVFPKLGLHFAHEELRLMGIEFLRRQSVIIGRMNQKPHRTAQASVNASKALHGKKGKRTIASKIARKKGTAKQIHSLRAKTAKPKVLATKLPKNKKTQTSAAKHSETLH